MAEFAIVAGAVLAVIGVVGGLVRGTRAVWALVSAAHDLITTVRAFSAFMVKVLARLDDHDARLGKLEGP